MAAETAKVTLKSGDRIVLVGGTMIEREQREGYWETALTLRNPALNLTFRNLGWSGDTVFGEARAWFDPPEKGYARLIEQTISEKPTVIVLNYGLNESFAGEPGYARFAKQYTRLVNDLAPAKAQIVLMLPPPAETMPAPLPSMDAANARLTVYRERIRTLAEKLQLPVLDIQPAIDAMPAEWKKIHRTDNGLHLTATGYRRTASLFASLFLPPAPTWDVRIGKDLSVVKSEGATVRVLRGESMNYEVTDSSLPLPPFLTEVPATAIVPGETRQLFVYGLATDPVHITSADKRIAVTDRATLEKGLPMVQGLAFDQAEQVRAQIVLKNQHYFNKWRPQNDTYLYGFRKHEQGQNFKELAQFDPLIAGCEAQISALRSPKAYPIVITPRSNPLPR